MVKDHECLDKLIAEMSKDGPIYKNERGYWLRDGYDGYMMFHCLKCGKELK
jgi:hypothetical protein